MTRRRGRAAAVSTLLLALWCGPWAHAQPAKEGVEADRPATAALSAAAADGRWTMVADAQAPELSLFDAAHRLVKRWRVATLDGKSESGIAALRHDAVRRSFVIALRDVPELWEISLDPQAEPIHDGLVHDYRMGESIATAGYLGVRRTRLERPLSGFTLDATGHRVIGTPRPVGACAPERWVIHLDVRLRIARLAPDGTPITAPPCPSPAQPPG